MHSIMYLRDRELQMRFSKFEAFYHGHVQDRETLAVIILSSSMIFAPLNSLINICSNGVTNSIFFTCDSFR